MNDLLGRQLGGKYEVADLIGQGAFGSVYRAVQHPVGRLVAIKVIAPRHGSDAQIRERFFREARAVAQLTHSSIVKLYDYGVEDDDLLYMVLEYVDGDELKTVLRREAPLEPERAVSIARQILIGLTEAHGVDLVHRDIKPGNVMLTRDPLGHDQVKLLDFGVAKLLGRTAQDFTLSGAVIGTPLYMAPEQAVGRNIGPWSDLYSAGVVLYEMLTGRPPFTAGSVFELFTMHREAPVPPMASQLAVPAPLEDAVRRALDKQPARRFSDAAGMALALSAALDAAATASVRSSPPPAGRVEPLDDTAGDDASGGTTEADTLRDAKDAVTPRAPVLRNERASPPLSDMGPSYGRLALVALLLTALGAWFMRSDVRVIEFDDVQCAESKGESMSLVRIWLSKDKTAAEFKFSDSAHDRWLKVPSPGQPSAPYLLDRASGESYAFTGAKNIGQRPIEVKAGVVRHFELIFEPLPSSVLTVDLIEETKRRTGVPEKYQDRPWRCRDVSLKAARRP